MLPDPALLQVSAVVLALTVVQVLAAVPVSAVALALTAVQVSAAVQVPAVVPVPAVV